jgi:hypothetical protein
LGGEGMIHRVPLGFDWVMKEVLARYGWRVYCNVESIRLDIGLSRVTNTA